MAIGSFAAVLVIGVSSLGADVERVSNDDFATPASAVAPADATPICSSRRGKCLAAVRSLRSVRPFALVATRSSPM